MKTVKIISGIERQGNNEKGEHRGFVQMIKLFCTVL